MSKQVLSNQQKHLRTFTVLCLMAALATFFSKGNLFAAPSDAPPSPAIQDTNSADLLRSNLQLQEQLHGLQLSIEENRKAADTAAAQNAESVANRLRTLEQTLAEERARDL